MKEGIGLTNDIEYGKLSYVIKKALDATKARVSRLANNAEWIFGRRAARALGGLALFAVVVALLFFFLNWYVGSTEPSEKKDLVLTLAQILAGTALLSGLYFTWRTLQVNREGQITERFTRAIDQLGSEKLEIRLGGIYALERIDKESPERAYHGTVMEVLTAYVRVNSRPTSVSLLGGHADILAILDVLERREEERVPEAHHVRINLSGANLQSAGLHDANLQRAILYGADLQGAFLSRANLQGAALAGANLQGAKLVGADLSEADLEGTSVKDEQLAVSSSLQDATMPDGSKHP